MQYSKESIHELTHTQLAGWIDYDLALEIANARFEQNKERETIAINQIPATELERVNRILGRIEEVSNG